VRGALWLQFSSVVVVARSPAVCCHDWGESVGEKTFASSKALNRAVVARSSGIQAMVDGIFFVISPVQKIRSLGISESGCGLRNVLNLEVSENPNESGLAKAFLRTELRINKTTRRMSNFTLPAGFI
jgi:hypothetical protein